MELNITLSSSSLVATIVTRLADSRGMSRSGCVAGSGIGSSGEGGTDGSRCGRDGVGSGFEGEVKAGGEGVDGKLVVFFTGADGGVDGGMTPGVRCEFLDDGFRCWFI